MKKVLMMLAVCSISVHLSAQTTKAHKTLPPPPPPPAMTAEVPPPAPPPPPVKPGKVRGKTAAPPKPPHPPKPPKAPEVTKEEVKFTPPVIVKDKKEKS